MKDIIPLEYAGQRVLTRPQIVVLLECNSADQVRNVVRNHRKDFVKGVHFFDLMGAEVSQFKNTSNYRLVVGRFTSQIVLWTKAGVELICKFFNTPKAAQVFSELEREYFTAAIVPVGTPAVVTIDSNRPQIFTIQDVRGYIDANQVAWLNAEDVARGLGFTEIANSGNVTIRWRTVRSYLESFGYKPVAGSCDEINGGSYIPENMFYRLAMKASNETAQKFQAKVADDILPELRKKGYYVLEKPLPPTKTTRKTPKPRSDLAFTYAFLMNNNWVKIGHAGEIDGRIKKVEYESHLKVITEHHTPKLKRPTAMRIERFLHKKFAAYHIEGEFYSASFEEVKEALDKISFLMEEEIIDVVSEPDEEFDLARAKLLVELCNSQPDSPFKEQLAKETANLLFGEKIF